MYNAITLSPTNHQKSFYGKAVYTVDTHLDMHTYTLYSYNTRICEIVVYDNHREMYFSRFWGGYSATTMKHINSFIDTIGTLTNTDTTAKGGKKWWDSLPICHW